MFLSKTIFNTVCGITYVPTSPLSPCVLLHFKSNLRQFGAQVAPKLNGQAWNGNNASSSADHYQWNTSFRAERGTSSGTNKAIHQYPNWNKQDFDYSKYEGVHVSAQGKDVPPPKDSFVDLNIHPSLLVNLENHNFVQPSVVQKHTIPIVLAKRDLMATAQTGSGKTAAYLLPMMSKILHEIPPAVESNDRARPTTVPRGIILAPTRELVMQIIQEAKMLTQGTKMRCVAVYGGESSYIQAKTLSDGAHIIAATPGRLLDFIDRGLVSLKNVQTLVLDEADRMLDMGFEPQIRAIIEKSKMPPAGVRQTTMWSATFPKEIQDLAKDFLSNYIFLSVGVTGTATNLVTQKFVKADKRDKIEQLIQILKTETGSVLIFAATKKNVDKMHEELLRTGIKCTSTHGDRTQQQRDFAIRAFSEGKIPIMIATNIAARGLDIRNVSHVINYDLPSDMDDFVHRIGRTGRAGKEGVATTFIAEDDSPASIRFLIQTLQQAKKEIPSWLHEYAGPSQNQGSPRRNFGRRPMRQSSGDGFVPKTWRNSEGDDFSRRSRSSSASSTSSRSGSVLNLDFDAIFGKKK